MSCEPKESLVEDLMLTLMVVSLVRLDHDRDRHPRDVRPGKYQQQPGPCGAR